MKKTVNVGIPAFNEEANIGFLINSLLKQNTRNFELGKIIVCSDKSSDKTEEIIKKIKSTKVKLLINNKRSGQAFSQNQIIKSTKADVLVLLNADIQIKDSNFLEKIVKPILESKADLTSVSVKELKPINLLEKILEDSMKFKKGIFEKYNNGNNIYTCHGRARAFSKNLFSKLVFKESVGEDAYSYLFCIKNKGIYKFVKNTEVFYRLPQTMSDHEKQSVRFYNSQELFNKAFGSKFVANQNFLTSKLLITELIKYFFVNPLIAFYFIISVYLKIKSFFTIQKVDIWQSAISSKNLRSN